jgi:hypothetical protein
MQQRIASPFLRRTSAARFGKPFLSHASIDYGSAEVLARLFLRWDDDLRKRRIHLSFVPAEQLLYVNRQNSESWRPLFPVFNAEVSGFNDDNGFALLGRNDDGQVIAAQAARLYNLKNATFKEETESLRLLYTDPEQLKQPGETCTVSAKSADRFRGRVVFSGAVWYHPDYRRQGLTSILPRLTKAYALTKWYTDAIVSFMAEDVVKGGTAERAGYAHVDWDVIMKNSMLGDLRLAFIWSSAAELMKYFTEYLGEPDPEIYPVVYDRAA